MTGGWTKGVVRAKASRVIVVPRKHTNALGETYHYDAEIAWTIAVLRVRGGDRVRGCNAALIVEAFNVANEAGLTPRQLAEQNNAMLVVLRGLAEHDFGANGDPVTYEALCRSARAVIANATGEQ